MYAIHTSLYDTLCRLMANEGGSGTQLEDLKGPLKRLVFLESEKKKASTKLNGRIAAINKWKKSEDNYKQSNGTGVSQSNHLFQMLFCVMCR